MTASDQKDVRIHVPWKMHSVIGTKAFGRSWSKPKWLSQHDHPTTLHTLLGHRLCPRRSSDSRGAR